MYNIMYNMKTATVRQVRHDFGEVLSWIMEGEEVLITRRHRSIARMIPIVPAEKNVIAHRDAAQERRIGAWVRERAQAGDAVVATVSFIVGEELPFLGDHEKQEAIDQTQQLPVVVFGFQGGRRRGWR